MKKRHKIVWNILRPPVGLFLRLKFGYKYEIAKNLPENYIVLSNHVTDWDPVFVGVSFKRNMYLVGSEHISRWKFAYRFLKWGFEPILRPKGALASGTVMDIIRHCRKGKSVCLFAEGARSWDGVTNPIAPATAKLIQSAKCALVTYKLTGGYFVSPMWSQSLRKGKISGKVQNIYTAEELSQMSSDEIYNIIISDLYEDAYARQLENPEKYIEPFVKSGADLITVHIETTNDMPSLIKLIRSYGVKVGITLNPPTPVEQILPYAADADMILVMTVNPGFGGQSLIEECVDKIRTLRKLYPDKDIEVDGGVKVSNLKTVTDAGANIIVAGSAVFGAENPAEVIKEMINLK